MIISTGDASLGFKLSLFIKVHLLLYFEDHLSKMDSGWVRAQVNKLHQRNKTPEGLELHWGTFHPAGRQIEISSAAAQNFLVWRLKVWQKLGKMKTKLLIFSKNTLKRRSCLYMFNGISLACSHRRTMQLGVRLHCLWEWMHHILKEHGRIGWNICALFCYLWRIPFLLFPQR